MRIWVRDAKSNEIAELLMELMPLTSEIVLLPDKENENSIELRIRNPQQEEKLAKIEQIIGKYQNRIGRIVGQERDCFWDLAPGLPVS